MGYKGNPQTKKALEEDGDQKDWPAADPTEEEGGHSWYLETPRDGVEPGGTHSDLEPFIFLETTPNLHVKNSMQMLCLLPFHSMSTQGLRTTRVLS